MFAQSFSVSHKNKGKDNVCMIGAATSMDVNTR